MRRRPYPWKALGPISFKELEGKSESARMDEYTRVDAEGGRAFGVVQIGIESGGGQIAAV